MRDADVKRSVVMLGIAVILIMAVAAFVGGQWLNGQTKSALPAVGANGKVAGGVDIEVIPAKEMPIYLDVTSRALHGTIPASLTTPQVIETMTIDDVIANEHVWVWGERRGDRILARVILFEN